MKILVIQQKRIGDVLVSTTLCNNLRKHLPESEIHYLVYSFTKDMVVGNPNIDEIVLFEDSDRTLVNIIRFALRVRRSAYDVVIDPYMKPQSRFVTLLSSARTRISFKSSFGIYNVTVPLEDYPPGSCGTVLTNRLNLLRPILGDDVEFDSRHRIFLSEEEFAHGRRLLESQGLDPDKPIAMFGIFGSASNKTYPVDYMLALLEWFQANFDAQVMLNYFPEQTDNAMCFYQSIKDQEHVYPNLAGEGLRDLASMLSCVTLYAGNDSGHTHIAKSMNVPTFTIWAPFVARYSWGVMDEMDVHDSVDVSDLLPHVSSHLGRRGLVPDSADLYREMRPDLVLPKMEDWLRSVDISPRQ